MVQTHFHQLHKIVCHQIHDAKHTIRIAVSWFTHKDIFDALIKKMQAGLEVSLIVEYDTKNFSKESQNIDFQLFIDTGGSLYVNRKAQIMHHKFMIVDEKLLLTGSYNWTYNTNAENLICLQLPEVIADFRAEYIRLVALCTRMSIIKYEGLKPFSTFPLFEESYFQLHELRKKVTNRIKTWYMIVQEEESFLVSGTKTSTTKLPMYFDALGDSFFADYWLQNVHWDKVAFKQYLLENKQKLPTKTIRTLRNTCLGFAKGDIIILADYPHQLVAIGIVQSEPTYCLELSTLQTIREVQWLEYPDRPPILLDIPKQTVGRYKGSVLALLQSVFAV